VLIVSAWEPELAPLAAVLGRGHGVELRAAGVGLVDAAAGAAAAIAETRPRAVVFVGTAGLYLGARPRVGFGDAAVVRRARLACEGVARGSSYFPEPLISSVETDRPLREALRTRARLPLADVACPPGITRSAAVARKLAATTGAALENLEVLAVARAAARAKVPFAAVLGVSNHVGPQAHAEWKSLAALASASACAAVLAWLSPRS
jgi:purine-nucleoside phosphorylase